MTLRYQINIRILCSSLCILLLGCSIVIWQARSAVDKEDTSSIDFAMKLISLSLQHAATGTSTEADWLPKFNSLKETRHLNIHLETSTGQIISIAHKNPGTNPAEQPPDWFVRLVEIEHPQTQQQITHINGKPLKVVIEANPLDEITEVWEETLAFSGLLLLLTVLSFLVVNLVLNKALKSIDIIVNALKRIETGQYQHKLPEFSTQEYDSIATAINHMTSELYDSQQQNRALTQHTLAIQEDERHRLAQELHDELGQSLTAIKVMAATAGRSQLESKKITDTIIELCNHLMTVVRSMMHQLHPLVLSELGLKATLEDLLQHWAQRTPDLKLTLNCPESIDTLPQAIAIQVFRVVQECLTNCVRYAEASQLTVDLSLKHGRLCLQVSDDGKGCTVDKIKTGFGLLGMKERMTSLGGEFKIQSQVNQGLTITAIIPLP